MHTLINLIDCRHHNECGNKAEYDLTCVSDGSTFYVCEKCDQKYSNCEICGHSGILDENMSFWDGVEEWPTCERCHGARRKDELET